MTQGDNILKTLSTLATELDEATQAVEQAEAALKAAKEKHRLLNEETIPEIMDEAGVAEFTTADGFTLKVADKLVGNITKANEQQAHQWLADNGFESLLKNQFKIDFGIGADEQARNLERYLAASETDAKLARKRYVHPSSLHAFLREQMADGHDVPLELFGVFLKRTTKVTK